MRIPFDNTYRQLPASFHAAAAPAAPRAPELIAFNEPLAAELGVERGGSSDEELARLLGGSELPEGAEPIAAVYAGHQFGHPVPRLGDGRAILLGEVVGASGRRDLQLKGAGRTAYSRGGDGRSPLGPVLREYLVSEAMHALGVPTTRALAAVATGEPVFRERGPEPGAVMTRVAASHLRVGTFEYFARAYAQGDRGDLEALLDYALQRHDPDLAGEEDRAFAFFERVARRTLGLVAQWWRVGFIHGVMNTDNTSISGETIDYGPCAFMDTFDPAQVYSSIDRNGRYRFENQAPIALWNLSILASCLVPLIDPEDPDRAVARLEELLSGFQAVWEGAWLAAMAPKLGIERPEPADGELIRAFLGRLEVQGLDYTNAWRALPYELEREEPLFARWRERLDRQGQPREEVVARMNAVNPYLIPRNHQIARAIELGEAGDFSHFHALRAALQAPYEERLELEPFTAPPRPDEVVRKTFCGT